MGHRPRTRADDERELRILRACAVEGLGDAALAERHGVSRNSVIGLRNRTRTADVAESGEPEGQVRGAYLRGNCIVGPGAIF